MSKVASVKWAGLCPDCGMEFACKRKFGIHRSRVHGVVGLNASRAAVRRVEFPVADVRRAFDEWHGCFDENIDAFRELERRTGITSDAWQRRLTEKSRTYRNRKGDPVVLAGWWGREFIDERLADDLLTAIGRVDVYREIYDSVVSS